MISFLQLCSESIKLYDDILPWFHVGIYRPQVALILIDAPFPFQFPSPYIQLVSQPRIAPCQVHWCERCLPERSFSRGAPKTPWNKRALMWLRKAPWARFSGFSLIGCWIYIMQSYMHIYWFIYSIAWQTLHAHVHSIDPKQYICSIYKLEFKTKDGLMNYILKNQRPSAIWNVDQKLHEALYSFPNACSFPKHVGIKGAGNPKEFPLKIVLYWPWVWSIYGFTAHGYMKVYIDNNPPAILQQPWWPVGTRLGRWPSDWQLWGSQKLHGQMVGASIKGIYIRCCFQSELQRWACTKLSMFSNLVIYKESWPTWLCEYINIQIWSFKQCLVELMQEYITCSKRVVLNKFILDWFGKKTSISSPRHFAGWSFWRPLLRTSQHLQRRPMQWFPWLSNHL